MESSSTATATGMASGKPLPKDLSHYLSVTAAARKPNAMKQYYRFFLIPGVGNLSGGKFWTDETCKNLNANFLVRLH